MGRRDPDPRPPIEVVGADPGLTSVQRVSTGPTPPKLGAKRALALVAAVVAILVVGLTLGGDDEGTASLSEREERDNRDRAALKDKPTTTQRRTTTTRPTTTTTTIPVGPVFGQPVGGALLVFGGNAWHVVDLDTGTRREVELPVDSPYEALPMGQGLAMLVGGSREATYFDVLSGAAAPEGVVLGTADQILPAGRPDRLWLIDSGGRFEAEPALPTAQVRLVDLKGGVLQSFEVPSTHAAAGVAEGIVLSRGGRAYLADEGGIRAFAVGNVLGGAGDSIVIETCDDGAACHVERRSIRADGPSVELVEARSHDFGYDVVGAADGRVALLGYGSGGPSPTGFFAADGRSLGSFDGSFISLVGLPRWLPGDLGLVAPGGTGVEWIHPRDGVWVNDPVPVLEGRPAEVLLVIHP